MRGLSEQQQIIKDLFLVMACLHLKDLENMVDTAMNLPVHPTLGSLIFPNKPNMKVAFDLLFDKEEEVAELLGLISSNHYLSIRQPTMPKDEYNLAKLFQMRDDNFRQAVQITKDGFTWLLEQTYMNPIFYNNSP
jgi:hypothetical protein